MPCTLRTMAPTCRNDVARTRFSNVQRFPTQINNLRCVLLLSRYQSLFVSPLLRPCISLNSLVIHSTRVEPGSSALHFFFG